MERYPYPTLAHCERYQEWPIEQRQSADGWWQMLTADERENKRLVIDASLEVFDFHYRRSGGVSGS